MQLTTWRAPNLGAITAGMALVVAGSAAAADKPAPTFTKDIAPILYRNCTSCHRPGEIAPMSLLTYQDARPWAKAIRTNVANGAMPPWFADPAYGKFHNTRRLDQTSIDTIVAWVNRGAPQGNPADLPPPPTYADGWSIGAPDAVFSMLEPFAVPADGVVEYQLFDVPTNFATDRWVQAIEIRPGNRNLVHHILVFAEEPGPPRRSVLKFDESRNPVEKPSPVGDKKETERNLGPIVASYAPGTEAQIFAPGTAMLIRAGATLTFQIHYTTNGATATDRSSVGLVFAKEPPATEIRNSYLANRRFAIPPGAAGCRVAADVSFTDDVTIWGLFPHTHIRGKSWQYRLLYPDGRSEIVLSVPKYDFNWQTYYMFEEPLKAPRGARLESVATYDNSKDNPANPDATIEVHWGDQTWEEMQYTGLTYTVGNAKSTATTAMGRR